MMDHEEIKESQSVAGKQLSMRLQVLQQEINNI